MSAPRKIGLIVPCYNLGDQAAATLARLTSSTLGSIHEILAIDNQSTDSTLESLKRFKQSNSPAASKLTLLQNQKNYGLGGSQKVAFRYLMEHEFTHAMIVHGDGQGDAEGIVSGFLAVLRDKPDTDFIAASRFHPKSDLSRYSASRRLANQGFNLLTRLASGQTIQDAGCGIICLKLEVLTQIPFERLTQSAQFNPQLNLLIYSSPGLSIEHIPLEWKDSDAGSSINEVKYSLKLAKLLALHRLKSESFYEYAPGGVALPFRVIESASKA